MNLGRPSALLLLPTWTALPRPSAAPDSPVWLSWAPGTSLWASMCGARRRPDQRGKKRSEHEDREEGEAWRLYGAPACSLHRTCCLVGPDPPCSTGGAPTRRLRGTLHRTSALWLISWLFFIWGKKKVYFWKLFSSPFLPLLRLTFYFLIFSADQAKVMTVVSVGKYL